MKSNMVELPLLQIVTPAYNEEECLEPLVQECEKVFVQLHSRYRGELIIVVDRSTDRTFIVAGELARKYPWIKAIHLSRRFGHQLALKAGLDYADADVVIMMDSDLQHPPALIPQLLARYEAGNNIVFTRRDGWQRSLLKNVLSRAFYKLVNKLSTTEILYNSSDFRLIDRKVLIQIQGINEFDPFLRGLFNWMGFKYDIVPFDLQKRLAGKPKYRLLDSLHLAVSGITSFSTLPLNIGIYAGLLSFIVSCLLFLLFISFSLIERTINWQILIVILISFYGSLNLMLIGCIGEYVGRIFLEQKKRPLYIIDEIIDGEKMAKNS